MEAGFDNSTNTQNSTKIKKSEVSPQTSQRKYSRVVGISSLIYLLLGVLLLTIDEGFYQGSIVTAFLLGLYVGLLPVFIAVLILIKQLVYNKKENKKAGAFPLFMAALLFILAVYIFFKFMPPFVRDFQSGPVVITGEFKEAAYSEEHVEDISLETNFVKTVYHYYLDIEDADTGEILTFPIDEKTYNELVAWQNDAARKGDNLQIIYYENIKLIKAINFV